MAVLTDQEKDQLRQIVHRMRIENGLTGKEARACLNDVVQAIEDAFETWKPSASTAVDNASSPYGVSYTNQDKKIIFKAWLGQRFGREVI